MKLISSLLNFVSFTSKIHRIDESHGLGHSMDVLVNAHAIYSSELLKHPILKSQERIIYTSASIHDMCDKKYMDPDEGIQSIELFLNDKITQPEIDITKQIISTMSYSKVKQNGFPELNEYQLAYHIVREADLLSAYDVDRCIIYNMNRLGGDLMSAFSDAKTIFENRIFKHYDDGLFITDYSKEKGKELEIQSYKRFEHWEKIISKL
jgi:hypothetical protein